MAISIPKTGAASPNDIANLVKKYGDLPLGYLGFLEVHDGATPPENVLSDTDNSIGVRTFLPASQIMEIAATVDGLSPVLIPIADDDSGNFVCIGSEDHKIYFWDHELDVDRLLANNFNDFVGRLELFDVSLVKIDPTQIERVWVNPNFKPEF